MIHDYYRLINKVPVPCSADEYSKQTKLELERMSNGEEFGRRVKLDHVGKVEISTVFHGINVMLDKFPKLFETMIFGGKLNGELERYFTWEEAEKGHDEMIKKVKEAESLE